MIANHASTRTPQLYDRRSDKVSLDEVERILIWVPACCWPILSAAVAGVAALR